MNSIVLFAQTDGWQPDGWVKSMGGTKSDSGQFVVETSCSWISFCRYDDVFSDYDDDEEQIVRSLIQEPTGYLIEWRGDDLLEKFIEDFASNTKAVIDNDHGLICYISKVKGLPVSHWFREKKLTN